MEISFVAAIGERNELGKDNDLLWHLPDDFKFFKEKTKGHCIIMGRKTFESLGKPLNNRTNIIVTHNPDFKPEGTVVFHAIEPAIFYANEQGETECMIIGGAQIFNETLHMADRLYITRVHGTFEDADVWFPHIELSEWKVVEERFHDVDEKHQYSFTFITYERK